MSDARFATSKEPGGAHHALARLAGQWVGTTQTWFEPGNPADTSETRARIRSVLDGRFVVYEYEGSFQGKPLLGMAILGYHIDSGRFTMAWIDSFHMGTATMQSEGKVGVEGLSVLGQYEVPGGPPWGWRTEFTLNNDDRFTVTAFNISPEGIESKAVETVYQRERT